MGEGTFWNGEPCDARKVWVVVAEWDEVEDPPDAWWRSFSGQRRAAVEVRRLDTFEVFYLDDEGYDRAQVYSDEIAAKLTALGFPPGPVPPGTGWRKVTEGRGMPSFGSSDVKVVPQLVIDREDASPGGPAAGAGAAAPGRRGGAHVTPPDGVAQAVRRVLDWVRTTEDDHRMARPHELAPGPYAVAREGTTVLVAADGAAGHALLDLVYSWGGEPQDASARTYRAAQRARRRAPSSATQPLDGAQQ